MRIVKVVFSILLLLFSFLSIQQGLQPPVDPDEIRKNYTAVKATVSALYEKKISEKKHSAATAETRRQEARDINKQIVPELSYTNKGEDIKKEFWYFGWNKTSQPRYLLGDKVEVWINNATDEVFEEGNIPGDSRTANIVIGVVMIIIVYLLWFGLVPGVLRKKG